MNGYYALRLAARSSKRTLSSIESSLDLSRNTISTCSRSGSSPRTDRLSKMLNCCGYKLVAVPKDTALTDDCYEID